MFIKSLVSDILTLTRAGALKLSQWDANNVKARIIVSVE